MARLAYLPLAKPFRTTFQYNSVTFRAAGFAAARANGTSWEELIRKRVLVPLGMKRTCLDSTTADKDEDRAKPHRLDAGEPQAFAATHVRKPDPIGSVHSSARELATWLRFHLDEGRAGDKRLVSARSLRQTHLPQIVLKQSPSERALFPDTTQSSYAMAWVVLDHRGHKLLAHGGALDGQRAQIILAPDKKLGIAVLSNLHQTPMNVALAFTLLELYLDVPKKRDWHELYQTVMKGRADDAEKAKRDHLAKRQPDTKPSHELSAYAGTYEHKAFGSVRVRLVRDKLVWEYHGEKLPLQHFHFDTFLVEGELPGDTEVVFKLDDNGGVRGFTIAGNFNATFLRADR
jgi:CubicO group peptidase (beta-lactamase class C family)